MENLKTVDISINNVIDISPLYSCKSLEAIDISANPIPKNQIEKFSKKILVHAFNLGNQEPNINCEFQKEINKRRINYLIHFTPTINLYSILEQGKIMSRAKLEGLDIEQFDVLDYAQFTDTVRYDDKNYINLSISSPNTFLFSKFRERTKNDITINWCVLKIDPKHIYEKGTKFSVTNAASNAAKAIGITGDLEKFKMLFADRINIPHGVRGRIKSEFPTNIQAEVLVKNNIPVDSIIEVCFESQESLAAAKAALYEFDTSKFVVDKEIFSPNRSL
ncbi:MAG: DUF4433 domain-containing protein [Bacteroidetes bacterium]|nr:MAG: DUF4433 domain-containing protein [Bacteroidota bacterium]